jgi:hypothetical protein
LPERPVWARVQQPAGRAVGEQPRKRDATNLECGFASQQFDQSDDLAAAAITGA